MPNKVEDKAIDFVMKYEQKAGREPRRLPDGKSYDIKSTQRCIEVKGLTCKDLPSNISIHPTILKKLRGDVSHYYIYIVYDIDIQPKLFIMPSSIIFSHLEIDPKLILHPKNIKKNNPNLKEINL